MPNPYESLPEAAFWRTAIAQRKPGEIDQLWRAKFAILTQHKVLTAGSCFAQHIGRALVKAGYGWHDSEPAPHKLSDEDKKRFNYGVFSFRTGNIYTVALLRQWLQWAFAKEAPSTEVWVQDGRYYDPFRPNIEPCGFATESELFAARAQTLGAIIAALTDADLFVFTLGLTEGWLNTNDGLVYPMCPGTLAGEFDAATHRFHNYGFEEIRRDLLAVFDLIQCVNPGMKFLLTVSPVPLTATASDQHVLVATTHSKSVLRAAAGEIASSRPDVDYFPSFEIISGFPFKGMFYEPNMRSVRSNGVAFVMQAFFAGLPAAGEARKAGKAGKAASAPRPAAAVSDGASEDDAVCEEMLLDAFARDAR